MRRLLLTCFAAFVALAGARDAYAEETANAPASIRVHVRLQREREVAEVFVERRGSWTSACHAPCSFDAAPGENVRVDIDVKDAPLESVAFTVANDGRGDHEIEVRRRGDAYLVGGLAMIGAGAVSLALGMAIFRGAGKDDLFGDGNRAVAAIAMLLGAASAATGTFMILRRSTAPYLVSLPPTRSEALEDLAPARSAAASPCPRPWATPELVWTTRF